MVGLKERFEKFVKTLDGFESVDVLLRNCDPHGKKRADYLLSKRQVIVEQKVLEVDPTEKPQKFFHDLMAKRRFKAYGMVSSEMIFAQLADGEKLRREILMRLTRALEGAVTHADKQTAATKEIFSIPSAMGILVLLNEKARMLAPDIVHYSLANVFQKTCDGAPRYPHNNGVILISEAHLVESPSVTKFFPIVTFTSPHKPGEGAVESFLAMVMERWAKFNGMPLVRAPARGLHFRPAPEEIGDR